MTFSAIVLAGSHGWSNAAGRDLPPRPLAHVALRPLISYPLQWLSTSSATAATVCGGAAAADLQRCLGDHYDRLPLQFRSDVLPRGAAGCVKDAAAGDPHSLFVVVEATVIPQLSLPDLLEAHRASGAVLTVVTNPGQHGDTEFEPAGIYVMQRDAIDAISPRGFQDIKEHLVPRLHRSGQIVRAYAASVASPRVGDLQSYLAVNHWLVQRDPLARRQGGDVRADASAVIDPAALIVGPVMVGARTRIDAGAVIVGPAVIGAGCVVESGALVSRSVLGESGTVRARAVIHSSIFGEGAVLDEGVELYGGVRLATSPRRAWPRLFGGATGARPRHNVPSSSGLPATRPVPELPAALANRRALHASEHN